MQLTELRGVGPRLAEKLAALGITTVQDLLFHLPLRYQDRTRITPIGALQPGRDAVLEGEVRAADIAYAIAERTGGKKTYVTFDIDCLDPAFAPGTGTPVAGGPSSAKILSVLRQMTQIDIVGADVVEVAPAYDHADITAIAGASVALHYIGLLAERKARLEALNNNTAVNHGSGI